MNPLIIFPQALTGTADYTNSSILILGVRVGLQLESQLIVDQWLWTPPHTGSTIIKVSAGLGTRETPHTWVM